jgi:hypothetical protein
VRRGRSEREAEVEVDVEVDAWAIVVCQGVDVIIIIPVGDWQGGLRCCLRAFQEVLIN